MLKATPALICWDPQHELHSKSSGVLSVNLEFADKLSTYSTIEVLFFFAFVNITYCNKHCLT